MRKQLFLIFLIASSWQWVSCNSDFTPRPRAYFNLVLPPKEYSTFSEAGYPYSFSYPSYARISKEPDSSGLNPYWINLEFPDFNARIHLSYKAVDGSSLYKVKSEKNGYRDSVVKNSFEGLREEAYKMTYKHTVRASAIVDSSFQNPHGSSGVYFYVAGEAATSRQFYVTDSFRHFLRGALYFDASPNADSLSLVSDYIAEDMRQLIRTIKWK